MRRQIRAELRKQATGRAWWILALSGVMLSGTTSYGYARAGAETAADPAIVTAEVVRAWMMLFLFSALFAAVVHTRDVASGALARSVLVSQGRTQVFRVRVLASLVSGSAFGLLALLLGVGSAAVLPGAVGSATVWDREVWLTSIGVAACSLLAAPFGLFVGVLLRSTVAATAALLLLTLLAEPGAQRLVPDVAQYLFTIALSGLYRDAKPEILSMPLGAVVALVWVLVLGVLARSVIVARDVT